MSKYGVYSSPYFPVFSPNTGKYRLEKTPYLDTFHVVKIISRLDSHSLSPHLIPLLKSLRVIMILHVLASSPKKTKKH